ncbi:MAG TPA: SIS domain-containing protein [Alphaproteobacteria bacterium]|jgi:glucosamine--fructose-6-phosphate aminotransferase (isomerizing)
MSPRTGGKANPDRSAAQSGASAGESLMLREAREAPAAVARTLAANTGACRGLAERLRAAPPPFAVTCARGSSDNAATFAKYLFELRLGLVTSSMGPSIRSVYAAAPNMRGALFLAISQSGRSPDLLQLAQAAREVGAVTVAVVNDAASPLGEICESVLPLRAGSERSVAATKSFIAALAAVLQLYAHWRGDGDLLRALDRLPDDLEAAAHADWSAALALLARAEHLYVVGRGVGLAVAQEAALKLKEAAGIHAEAVSAAELMHGPLALAGADFPVLVFAQPDEAEAGLLELVQQLRGRNIPVILAARRPLAGVPVLPVSPAMNAQTAPVALIQSFYPLADAIARARGRDPDRPPHLSKVTETL